MATITYREALNAALDEEMARDPAAYRPLRGWRTRLGPGAAVAPVPLLVPEAADAVVGGELTDESAAEAGVRAAAACSPISDARGTAEYRRDVTAVLVRRALRIAWLRATGSWPAGALAPINGVLPEEAA